MKTQFFLPLWNYCSTAWHGSWGRPDQRSCGEDTETGHSVLTPRDNPRGKKWWEKISVDRHSTGNSSWISLSCPICPSVYISRLLPSPLSYQFKRLAFLWSCHSWCSSSCVPFCRDMTFLLWVRAACSVSLVEVMRSYRKKEISHLWHHVVEMWKSLDSHIFMLIQMQLYPKNEIFIHSLFLF